MLKVLTMERFGKTFKIRNMREEVQVHVRGGGEAIEKDKMAEMLEKLATVMMPEKLVPVSNRYAHIRWFFCHLQSKPRHCLSCVVSGTPTARDLPFRSEDIVAPLSIDHHRPILRVHCDWHTAYCLAPSTPHL
jgi:hypothetical protein